MNFLDKENKWITPLVEGIGVMASVVIVSLVGIYIFPFILILYPLAFIVYGTKHGLLPSGILLIITGGLIAVGVDIISGIIFILAFAPVSLGMIYSIKRRRRPLEILLTGSLLFFISVIFIFGAIGNFSGISMIKQLEETFKETLFLQLEMLESTGLSNLEIARWKEMLEDAYKYMLLILPSIIMIIAFGVSYLNYLITGVILRLMGIGILPMPRLHKFSVPNNFALGMMVMFVGIYIGKQFDGRYFDTILLNLIVLIGLAFILQGIAVIDYFLLKIKFNKIIRGVLIVVTIIMAPVLTFVSLLGGIDMILDFRKIRRRKSQ